MAYPQKVLDEIVVHEIPDEISAVIVRAGNATHSSKDNRKYRQEGDQAALEYLTEKGMNSHTLYFAGFRGKSAGMYHYSDRRMGFSYWGRDFKDVFPVPNPHEISGLRTLVLVGRSDYAAVEDGLKAAGYSLSGDLKLENDSKKPPVYGALFCRVEDVR